MSKRGATTDINHDNWDAPIEPEKPGVFSPASQEELQKRVIRTAKRRIKTSDNNDSDSEKKNIFASFGGFKPAPSINSTNSSVNATSKPMFGSFGSAVSSSNVTTPAAGVDSKAAFGFLATKVPSSNTNGSTGTATANPETKAQQTYVANLTQLNKSVSDWIKQHVDANPICILSPIFKEYDDYLKKIQDERDSKASPNKTLTTTTAGNSGPSTFNLTTTNAGSNKFAINFPTKSPDGSKPATIENKEEDLGSSNEETGKSPLLQNKDTKPSASIFGSFKSESSGSSLFTKPDTASLMVNPFLSKPQTEAKPFSFSNGAAPTSFSVSSSNDTKDNKEKEEEDEESDEPPKVEFTPVQEEGSLFSTRCKVFVKKDSTYTERGVGTLFIKQVSEGKHQLLVRAETVIGTVLLNLLLAASVPTQRMGKNNVMLVCIPTPQEKPPPTTVLLRVKTADEADQLLATIQKYKQ